MPRVGDNVVRQQAGSPFRGGTLGRYRIVAELAQGGMGVVYLALMRGPGAFNKLLVLKELKPELFEEPSVVAMFMEEARLAACLSHVNVVQTIEAGSDGDRHFIVMEYVEGQSLFRVVSRARRLGMIVPFELQSAVLCSALGGLAYAHAATDLDGRPLGIVHRDVSPHNVLIGYDGQVKLVDFGIAKTKGSMSDTRVGLLKGRVAYMAPEQAAGANVDARADVFSVGVMLSEAATGRRFWSGIGGDIQVLRALLVGDADAAHAREMSDVDPNLRAIIARATAFEPAKRHPSATHLLEELRTALAKRPKPLFNPQQIGSFVQGLFVEERIRLQAAVAAAVESDVDSTDGTSHESSGTRVPGLWHAPSASMASRPSSQRAAWEPSAAPEAGVASSAVAPSSEGRWLLSISVVVLLASVATLVGLIAIRRSTAATQQPPATTSTTPAVAPPPAVTNDEPIQEQRATETIHVLVRAAPARARIVIDRNLVFENPCLATLPKDGEVHTVHVEADGYSPRDDTFEARGDVTLVVALEPRRGLAHPSTAPPRVAPPPAAVPQAPVPPEVPTQMASAPPPSPSAPPAAPPQTGAPQRRINTDNPYNR